MKSNRIVNYALAAVVVTTLAFYLLQQRGVATASIQRAGQPCAYHGVADSLCTRCHPDLVAAFKAAGDWCAEHKLPESQCDLCNPGLRKPGDGHDHSAHDGHDHSAHAPATPADAHDGHNHGRTESVSAIDWCAEHRVPESACTKCNAELIPAFKAKHDWCGGHGIPESHCYLCNPGIKFPQEAEYNAQREPRTPIHPDKPKTSLFRSNSSHCASDDAVIQLASIETAGRAGLKLEAMSEAPAMELIEAPAEVEFDASASTVVTCLVRGTLVRWLVEPGESVRAGQTIAYLESLETAELQAEFAHARALLAVAGAAFDRQRELANGGMASTRELQDAEAEFIRAQADYRKAAATLQALGYTERELAELSAERADVRLPLRARDSGTLVERIADPGTVVEAGEPIGQIARTDQLWIEAQVRERDFQRVQPGQPVTISSDGDALDRCAGTVSWVAAAVDPVTRMGRVRIAATSGAMTLRAHQYARVQIAAGSTPNQLLVPQAAVQWEGCCNVVFVAESPDRFKPRKVTVHYQQGGWYAVSGVQPGERIVTQGSYLLKTELMKSSIGEGCCGAGA